MKTLTFSVFGLLLTCSIISCADKNHRYIDLETGNYVDVVKDSTNGKMVNADTREPVIIYVDTQSKDTIYGKTGKVINGNVTKTENGKYKYVSNDDGLDKIKTGDDGAYKVKDGDYKKKVDKDGDIKIKDGDKKIKIDGKTGEKKVKSN
ncbi:MAG: hypothetical protein M3015_12330 [Bacteroidota bacterium]|nr:hypothetical protein [Bacteroidota bacterium]